MYGKTVFSGLGESDIREISDCLSIKKEKFNKDDEILRYGNRRENIFIILKGEANLVRIDYNGNRTVFERLKSGSVFSDIFISDLLLDFMSVRCLCDCDILFINYKDLISPCDNMCSKHFKFLAQITDIIISGTAFYNDRINLLSRRTIKSKLFAYFSLLASREGKPEFILPVSFSELADYLSVDRSAMMREIAGLKKEGAIKTDRRKIMLLRSEE